MMYYVETVRPQLKKVLDDFYDAPPKSANDQKSASLN